jgi:uncharacterized metal-binding protein YceD (DUF177 family)
MKIFLHEITEQGLDLDFTDQDQWVVDAVQSVDELPEDSFKTPKKRSIKTHLSLRKVDGVIVVNGKLDTYIELICSRCAISFQHVCRPNFSALFCQDPVMAGVAHLQRQGKGTREAGKPVGQNQGFARHAHNPQDDIDMAEGKDLDITYLSHDFIDLSDVLLEQLQLQVPFQPLCKEDCKGMCVNCGTDLNQGRCACSKIAPKNAFSVLSNLKF